MGAVAPHRLTPRAVAWRSASSCEEEGRRMPARRVPEHVLRHRARADPLEADEGEGEAEDDDHAHLEEGVDVLPHLVDHDHGTEVLDPSDIIEHVHARKARGHRHDVRVDPVAHEEVVVVEPGRDEREHARHDAHDEQPLAQRAEALQHVLHLGPRAVEAQVVLGADHSLVHVVERVGDREDEEDELGGLHARQRECLLDLVDCRLAHQARDVRDGEEGVG